MKTIAAALVGFALGVTAVVIVQNLSPQPFLAGLKAPMCEAVVRIWLDNGQPKVTPIDTCLAMKSALTWDIDPQMAAGQVVIDFDYQGQYHGPFEDKTGTGVGSNPHNKGRGKYVRDKGDSSSIHSNAAEKTGRWTYNVTYIVDGKSLVADPAVCIRN